MTNAIKWISILVGATIGLFFVTYGLVFFMVAFVIGVEQASTGYWIIGIRVTTLFLWFMAALGVWGFNYERILK